MTILQALILVGVAWVACVLVICAWFMARDALAKGRADAADEEEDWRSHPDGVAHLFYQDWEQERGFPPRIDDQRRD